jgi:hypothetical protein
VGTSWTFADLDRLSEPVDWTVSFYSRERQSIYVVNVSSALVTPLQEALSPYALEVIPLERWQVDSHQALGFWLDSGGADFVRAHPVADVSARVGLQDGRVVWVIVGADRAGSSTFVVQLDATDGERLE